MGRRVQDLSLLCIGCEAEMMKQYQHLLKDWPDHWTDALQPRLENLNETDHHQSIKAAFTSAESFQQP